MAAFEVFEENFSWRRSLGEVLETLNLELLVCAPVILLEVSNLEVLKTSNFPMPIDWLTCACN